MGAARRVHEVRGRANALAEDSEAKRARIHTRYPGKALMKPAAASKRSQAMTGWVSLMGDGSPNGQGLPQIRVEVVEGRVCLYPQGVQELAEEAAGGRRRGNIEDVLVLVTVRPEQLDIRGRDAVGVQGHFLRKRSRVSRGASLEPFAIAVTAVASNTLSASTLP